MKTFLPTLRHVLRQRRPIPVVLFPVCIALLLGEWNSQSYAQTVAWTQQLGTSEYDWSYGVSADGLGNVYISGSTVGDLAGTNAGEWDAFVSRYDEAGNLVWTQQLGSSTKDESAGVSADGLGNVYISGWTYGDLAGTNAGRSDAFVSKYDEAGNLVWTQQLGSSGWDESYGVSADGLGSVYISGSTEGDLAGTNAGRSDAFVSKYDEVGNLVWTQQLGTRGGDGSTGVSADGLGNVYISGWTEGDLAGTSAGTFDAFVSKYDEAGNLVWTQQLGSSDLDWGRGVSADGLGNVYISGSTYGDLVGTNARCRDAFVSKYDEAGNLVWTQQLGSSASEI